MIFGSPDARTKYPHIFVKTQFAGIENHIKIINLLTYLKKKYFKVLHITDEGGYYPKKDLDALSGRMEFIGNAIDTIRDVFENAEFDGSPEEVMNQMREALSRSLKGAQVRIIKFQMGESPEEIFPKKESNENEDITDEDIDIQMPHEIAKRFVGRMIETFTLYRGIEIRSSSSTTFKRSELQRGFEADESYYIQHASELRGVREIDLTIHPPPDLVIEVDMTNSSIPKKALFAAMSIPEVWRYD